MRLILKNTKVIIRKAKRTGHFLFNFYQDHLSNAVIYFFHAYRPILHGYRPILHSYASFRQIPGRRSPWTLPQQGMFIPIFFSFFARTFMARKTNTARPISLVPIWFKDNFCFPYAITREKRCYRNADPFGIACLNIDQGFLNE